MEILKKKLRVRNISKISGQKQILDRVEFDVYDGEFFSILGPSGCGKTTLLRILIGLETADTGSILKDDREIISLKPSERKMGIVFQNYALFENMTVLENVRYALQFDPGRKQEAEEIAKRLLVLMGLNDHMAKKPRHLSGGQQQRVAIARTLAFNPDIILFDEPMSALDVSTRLGLRNELKKLQKQFGTTMIYVTHDQEEAFAMSDRIMVMDTAKVVQVDTPENIIKEPANSYVKEFVVDNLRSKLDFLMKYVR